VTLLDLLLVAVITSILAVVGIPSMVQALIHFRLEAAATEVIAAVEYAQATALANGCDTSVLFDVTENEVEVQIKGTATNLNGGDVELDETAVETIAFHRIEHPLNKRTEYVIDLTSRGWSGAVVLSAVDFDGTDRLEFDERGAPSSGGTVTLENDGWELTLVVDAQAGKMTIQGIEAGEPPPPMDVPPVDEGKTLL